MLFFTNGREIKYLLGDKKEFLQVVVGEYQSSGQLMTPSSPKKPQIWKIPKNAHFRLKFSGNT